MTALLLQTLVLMIPAFFLGAALACGIRRMMAPQTIARVTNPVVTQAAPVEPLAPYAARTATAAPVAAVTTTAATGGNRFDDALKGRAVEPPRPAPTSAPASPQPTPAPERNVTMARPAPPPPPAPKAAIVAPVSAPVSTTINAPVSASVSASVMPAVKPAEPPAAPRPAVVAAPAPVPATAEMIASAAAAATAAAAAVAAQARTVSATMSATVTALAPQQPAPPAAPSTPAAAPTPVAAPLVAPLAAPLAAAPVTKPIEPASVVPVTLAPVATAGPEDLARIGMIDQRLADQLKTLGVTRFSQIAAWRTADVKALSDKLGFQGRIEQENWIEQAHILASGGETYYSARRGRAPAPVAMTPIPSSADAAKMPTVAALDTAITMPRPAGPQVPVRSAFADEPAAQRPATPTAAVAPVVPTSLAATASTAAAGAVAAASAAVAAATAAVMPPAAKSAATLSAVADAAKSDAAHLPDAAPVRPAMTPQRDNLQRIGGINAEIERLLGVQGITRYNQIAGWSSADVERFDRLLGSQGRVHRENWVEQAQILAKGGDTAYSRDFDRRAKDGDAPKAVGAMRTPLAAAPIAVAPVVASVAAVAQAVGSSVAAATDTARSNDAAARPLSIADAIRANTGTPTRQDISGLRSVRSEAYRAPAVDAATAAAAAAAASTGSAKVVRSAEIDDLKRIRGIGVLIEKRLNSVGIVSYAQIAEWTNEDIDRVSATLDFKGRIERENWVEQARILASGGQTEFSRRVDRGEVETSKPR